jgi:hypothetical protein
MLPSIDIRFHNLIKAVQQAVLPALNPREEGRRRKRIRR